jgi:hypothetical protein
MYKVIDVINQGSKHKWGASRPRVAAARACMRRSLVRRVPSHVAPRPAYLETQVHRPYLLPPSNKLSQPVPIAKHGRKMDHSHMDHGGHMGHDMPGMGGDGPKCNMNVRLHPSLLVSILKRTYADFR